MIENYLLHLFILVCIYSIMAMSMNLALGFTGMVNLAHIAFYAIGAYTSALLAVNFGVPFWASLLAAGLLAAFFGWLISFPTVRLRGDYIVLGTLGLAVIIQSVIKNEVGLTRGPIGIPGIPRPVLFGVKFATLELYALLALAVLALTFVVLWLVVASPFGRVIKAVRDDEIAARALGKDVVAAKTKVLALSAFFAGIAGSLYAHYITFIDPSTFGVQSVVFILSYVLIGGTGSMWGSIAGTALLLLLPEPLRLLHLPPSIIGGMRQALYALLLILVILKRPQGLIGEDTLHSAWRKITRRAKV